MTDKIPRVGDFKRQQDGGLVRWNGFEWRNHNDKEDKEVVDNVAIQRVALKSAMERLLLQIDPDASRGGLLETPERAAKAWQHWTSGYAEDPATVLKVFEDGAESYDEMVIVADIPVYSHCEHHLATIFGTATVAYIPDGKIVGLSKINRVVDLFARRLQVQERMTAQVADAINDNLKPKGVAVMMNCRHMCMESRGVRQQGTYTITSALRGVFKEDAAARAEFFNLIKTGAPK